MAAPRKPSEIAFTGRKTDTNASGIVEPVTKFNGAVRDDATRKRHSSFPHLTPATPATPTKPARPEHLTDVTHVGTVIGPGTGVRYDIHQRFHQDNVSGSPAVHDRFIATDSTGKIYNASADLNAAVHQKRAAKVPARGDTLASTADTPLSFTVGTETGDPPLSPRTRARKVTGYF